MVRKEATVEVAAVGGSEHKARAGFHDSASAAKVLNADEGRDEVRLQFNRNGRTGVGAESADDGDPHGDIGGGHEDGSTDDCVRSQEAGITGTVKRAGAGLGRFKPEAVLLNEGCSVQHRLQFGEGHCAPEVRDAR